MLRIGWVVNASGRRTGHWGRTAKVNCRDALARWAPPMDHHRRLAPPSILTGVVLGIVVVLAGLAGTWNPTVHSECKKGELLTNSTMWMPLSLLNTPSGGAGYVNSSSPADLFSPSSIQGFYTFGGGETNGTVWGAFWKVSVSVFPTSNQTVWGPGPDARCNRPFELLIVSVSPAQGYIGGIFLWPGAPQFGPNETSDRGEPAQLNFSASPGDSSALFSNGYSGPPNAGIDTCGGSALSIETTSTFLNVRIPISTGGKSSTVLMTLPLTQHFHYVFPASYGSWGVDNLSQPGGPGGGWAFDYLGPCP